jgi:hypothetical protein
MAFDYHNNPRIVYFVPAATNATTHQPNYLKYASQSGAAWSKQVLPQTGEKVNLAVDSKNTLHLLTTANVSKKFGPMIWYTTKIGTDWTIRTVDEGDAGSLALDSTSNPHVAYCNDAGTLQYSRWSKNGWDNQTVDNSESFDDARSLLLDSKGNPHILYSYRSSSSERLATVKYAEWNNQTGWKIRTAFSNISYKSCGNMVLDSNNKPHFTFVKENSDNTTSLMYASLMGDSWIAQTVASNLNWQSAESASLALDADDEPHITYLNQLDDADSGNFTYAEWNGRTWSNEVIDSSSCSTGPILLDAAGKLHVSYVAREPTNNDTCLIYATNDETGGLVADGMRVLGATILVIASAAIVGTGLFFGKRKTEED